METPAELIRKARNRAKPKTVPARSEAPLRAPIPHHAVYTGIMKRHDRVRTRHLAGQSTAGGA